MTLLYEGKTKQVLSTSNANEVFIRFTDKAATLNGKRAELVEHKADVTAAINKYFFNLINSLVPHHIISFDEEGSYIAKKLKMIPIKFVVRNFAAGSVCERRGYNRGEWIVYPLLEHFLKSDELSDPEILEEEIVNKGILNYAQIDILIAYSRKINQFIWTELISKGLYLVDIKLEFGTDSEGNMYLADEISPDTCRIWDIATGESLDKDVYIENKADLVETYLKLAERLEIKV